MTREEYKQMRQLYADNFSLGYLNTDASHKFVLISLICYLCSKARAKRPDATCYQVIHSLNKENIIPEFFELGLSVVCEDFMYQCTEFPTFGVEKSKIIPTITDILKQYMPF